MSCGECKYFGFRGLTRHCRHPEHPLPIVKWPGECRDFIDIEKKIMPGKAQPWPEPVEFVDTESR